MDGVSNSLGFGSSSSDPKAALMNQVRQEAALQNAKQLIEVCNMLGNFDAEADEYRNSMSTASRSVCQNPELPSRAANRLASRNVWRSTWGPGIL
jgi:hypothetical protein